MKILRQILDTTSHTPIRTIAFGLRSCLVESRVCGVATTLDRSCCIKNGEKNLDPDDYTDAKDLAQQVFSNDLFRASVGMAALNSLLPHPSGNFTDGKGQHLLLEKGQDKKVAVIGHFPFVDKYSDKFKSLMVFEKKPKPGDLKDTEIPARLPEAEIIALTATTLFNHSFKDVMKHRASNSYVIMLGPSTPLSPVLFDFGVNALSGSIVCDIEQTKKDISFARPFRDMKGLRYINLFASGKDN